MPTPNKALSLVPSFEVNSAGDEPRCICIIASPESSRKHVLTLPCSTSIDQLFEEIAKKLHFVKGTFAMTFSKENKQPPCDTGVQLEDGSSMTLSASGFQDSRQKNYLFVRGIDGQEPKSSQVTTITEDTSDIATTSTNWSYTIPPPPPLPSSALHGSGSLPTRRNAIQTTGPYNFKDSISKAASRIASDDFQGVGEGGPQLRGLVNQAMTCYLNSLIQTLFMTPEFRNALYMWEFKGPEESAVTTIPYQLQRLFLAMQTSDKQAVETTDLTKSFGWDSSEAWQQHDIQELCRVMLDALEQELAKTDQAEIIKLFEGKMKDYVQCCECKNESARMDAYLDIPITIRPFGSTVAYKNVMEGLKAFVEAETLDGSNQYFCEKCNRKCDAKKGLKFVTFPYLLTLQLKRFDFDYSTMHRVKLNDRMFFPQELDLSSFIEDENIKDSVSDPESDCVNECEGIEEGIVLAGALPIEEEEGDHSSRDSGNDDDRPYSGRGQKRTTHHSSDDSEEGSSVDEGIDIESQKSYGHSIPGAGRTGGARTDEDSLGSGGSTPGATGGAPEKEVWDSLHGTAKHGNKTEHLYELYSIMIHSGSAVGGHYYAYIKSFDDGQWYSFNDQVVSAIQLEDIEKSYGGASGRSSYQSSFSSSTNAYMLMYRLCDKRRNADFIKTEDLPEHIKQLSEREKEQENILRENKEKEKNMCGIKVYCQHPSLLKDVSLTYVDETFEFHSSTSLRDATDQVYKLLKLDPTEVKRENCRLVKYDSYHHSLDQSLDDVPANQDEPLATLLGGPRMSYLFDLLLETREDTDEPFQVYKVGGITVKAYAADYTIGRFREPIIIRMMQNDNIYALKQIIAKRLHFPTRRIRLAYEKYSSEIQLLTMPTKTLKDVGFFRSAKIYADVMTDEEFESLSQQPASDFRTDSFRSFVKETRLWKLVDRASNLLTINVILPEDAPPYVLPPTPPITPPSIQEPSNQPISQLTDPESCDEGKQTTALNTEKITAGDEVKRGNKNPLGGEAEEHGVPYGSQDPRGESENVEEGFTDEITLFWKSPEKDYYNTQNLGKEGENPLPSTSTHLRRNSQEDSDWDLPTQSSYCPLSAQDFQAELDRKFLAAGFAPTSPTSSLKCEDGSSSDGASETSGELDISVGPGGLQGDGATDSAGSCSTVESTDTLCNDPMDTQGVKRNEASKFSFEDFIRDDTTVSCDLIIGDNVPVTQKDIGTVTHSVLNASAPPSATKSTALPGMARPVQDSRPSDIEMYEFNSDGTVVKSEGMSRDSEDSPGLCQCNRTQGEGNSPYPNGDNGPSYQCSRCGKLKPECVFTSDSRLNNIGTHFFDSSLCPESGEGLDNISPLFGDIDTEERGAGDPGPGAKSKYTDITPGFHKDEEKNTRQRTESSSSDLGWEDQTPRLENCYFHVYSVHTSPQKCQVLQAKMDKRSVLGWLKKQLQPIVQAATRDFSVYRLSHGGMENELNCLSENFNLVADDTKFRVKYERALRRNEHRCKVFQLVISEDDPVKHSVDWVVRRGLTVREARVLVAEQLEKQCQMTVKPENIRLRKKCWRNPGKIFLDSDKFGSDILLSYSQEFFVEILQEPEKKSNHNQLAVYCRRWRPSTLTLDPIQEVILDPDSSNSHSVEELKRNLLKLADIDVSDIEWTKPNGIFPCHTSVLEISQLDWETSLLDYLHCTPANITEDGSIVFYRNKNEKLRELSECEKSEMQSREAARLATAKTSTSVGGTKSGGSSLRPYSRKEKALKIYTVESHAKKEVTTTL